MSRAMRLRGKPVSPSNASAREDNTVNSTVPQTVQSIVWSLLIDSRAKSVTISVTPIGHAVIQATAGDPSAEAHGVFISRAIRGVDSQAGLLELRADSRFARASEALRLADVAVGKLEEVIRSSGSRP